VISEIAAWLLLLTSIIVISIGVFIVLGLGIALIVLGIFGIVVSIFGIDVGPDNKAKGAVK
jgi:hypothetical protein